ncbi:MAG: alpha/beta hydrolase [Bacteroidia bacterium]
MHLQHFKTTKTARVYTNTNDYESIEFVWVALHGYGQLASYFSKKFEGLDSKKHLVIVPEAQSRFYLNGVGILDKKIGATWMTKEDRETDIADYVQYLNNLKLSFEQKLNKNIKWIVFGFSQGAATACRWIQNGIINPDHLVLYAGIFPPDLDITAFENKKFMSWQLRGDKDEFWNKRSQAENDAIVSKLNIKPNWIPFKGKHKVYAEVLQALVLKIENT